ncbi:MAG: NAD(P)-dependent oxidoreductase [Smithellaceae bacterium]|nr:NAD(P)-dependent oxidoreductase [Smithellaceae bacterium]
MITRAGFIGLGVMGRPMAENLLKGGYRLSIYGRRKESLAPLAALGAEVSDSPAEVARKSEVIFTMVTYTRDVEEVVLGSRGIVEGAGPGVIVVDMSTISPSATRMMAARLAESGIEMLDAPVSGGEIGARDATLSIMAGGEKEVFDRVLPLFSCLGKKIVHIGPNGAGQVAKACNQVVLLITIHALAEAFAFARKNGVSPERVYEAISGGSAQSRILEVLGKRMIERDYARGIEARLHYKDIRMVMEEAHRLGLVLPGTALVTELFNALIGRGGGHEDSSQLIEVIEAMTGRPPLTADNAPPGV